jgi:hypothetical protein
MKSPKVRARRNRQRSEAMQHAVKMTAAKARTLFRVDIVDAPPLRVEAVDQPAQPPLAAIAPEPPGEPIPGGNLGSVNPPHVADLRVSKQTEAAPPSPPTAAEAHAASVREAAIARRRQAKPRMASSRRPLTPVPPPTVGRPGETWRRFKVVAPQELIAGMR